MGVGAFFFRHRLDERDLALKDLIVHSCRFGLFGHFTHARHHAHNAFHAAHFHHLFKLHFQVVHVELTLLKALHHALGLFGFDGFLCFFNEGNNVPHAQNAPSDALWFKGCKRIHLFAKTDEANGLTSDSAHRERGSSAAIPVHAG